MSTQNNSITIQAQIDQVTAESATFIGAIEKDLATAREQRFTAEYQLEIETKLTQSKAMYDGVLNRLEGELTTAREKEIRAAAAKQQEQVRSAAEVKAQIKSELKAKWIESHGDLDIFEAQFPQLYAEEISRRAVDKMITGDGRGQARVISNF